ncbi:U2 snRNP-associated SURP motif-containing protein isoform X1 [Daphnia magna]|uniref:U2 snRNP-associated SURP motif-containing protein isoform X1 n=1 Tax=Daphnia magna TaxID=35525 RepID=UPI001E1BD13E|nr:U2 snRNP-associated SURP motif-containing protein isoform X1 [Daphnia magna]
MAKRGLSRKELEEIKKREEIEAAAEVFEEFVATFQEDASKVSKVWVKAGTYDAGQRKEDAKDKGKLYKPTSKLASLAESFSTRPKPNDTKDIKESKDKSLLKKEKKKSNLEMFKEELRVIQEEREERHRVKAHLKPSRFEPVSAHSPSTSKSSLAHGLILPEEKTGSFDVGDPNTTNIYLGNINPKMTEQQLMDIFGKYGPLASVKIMWPRTEEEKARNRNCGFVAFMCRKDAERAMKKLNGKDILSFEMKLGWGKALPIPSRPIYIPPALLEKTLPPPPTGLPFNAIPAPQDIDQIPPPGTPYPTHGEALENFNKIISRAVVKVVIPTDRNLLCLIHRMIESVVREGPMLEAMMMNKEIDNPQFRFLFENRSPAHIYYRWKLFSILQGEAGNKWSMEDFRMFKGGSIWKPPSINPFSEGMPDELFSSDEEDDESRRRSLSKSQKKRLELMLRKLTPEKTKVAEAMIFCIEHAEAYEEIIDFITESLNSVKTSIPKKLGRFFLVSDVLYNSSAKAVNASNFRSGFQSHMVEIVKYMHQAYEATESRLKAEAFRQRVMLCFRAWEEWNLYPADFLIHLQNVFLGLVSADQDVSQRSSGHAEDVDGIPLEDAEAIDGAPLSDSEDLDGVPLDGAALLRSAVKLQTSSPARTFTVTKSSKYDADFDGVPMSEELDGVPMRSSSSPVVRRDRRRETKSSKWETPAPVVATSKWDNLDPETEPNESSKKKSKAKHDEDIFADVASTKQKGAISDEDLDGAPLDSSPEATRHSSGSRNEDQRGKLRELELKVIRYQDELEAGIHNQITGMSISEQVQQYREHLLRKSKRDRSQETGDSREHEYRERRTSHGAEKSDRSGRQGIERERYKEKDRRRSISRSRSRSRSPRKSSRSKRTRSSRSPSPSHSLRRTPRRSRSKSDDSSKRSRRSRSRSSSPRRTPKSQKKSKNFK